MLTHIIKRAVENSGERSRAFRKTRRLVIRGAREPRVTATCSRLAREVTRRDVELWCSCFREATKTCARNERVRVAFVVFKSAAAWLSTQYSSTRKRWSIVRRVLLLRRAMALLPNISVRIQVFEPYSYEGATKIIVHCKVVRNFELVEIRVRTRIILYPCLPSGRWILHTCNAGMFESPLNRIQEIGAIFGSRCQHKRFNEVYIRSSYFQRPQELRPVTCEWVLCVTCNVIVMYTWVCKFTLHRSESVCVTLRLCTAEQININSRSIVRFIIPKHSRAQTSFSVLEHFALLWTLTISEWLFWLVLNSYQRLKTTADALNDEPPQQSQRWSGMHDSSRNLLYIACDRRADSIVKHTSTHARTAHH